MSNSKISKMVRCSEYEPFCDEYKQGGCYHGKPHIPKWCQTLCDYRGRITKCIEVDEVDKVEEENKLDSLVGCAVRYLPILSCYECSHRDVEKCKCKLTTHKQNMHPLEGIPSWCPLPKSLK